MSVSPIDLVDASEPEALEPVLLARLAALDLEQKVRLLTGADAWSTCAEPAAGLARMVLSDGPVGVRGRNWDERDTSVNIPSPTALAASWDEDLVERLGLILAAEARRKDVAVLLAPTVNLHRSPYAGRHFECLSEDPLLSGRIAAAYVRGVQAGGVAATAKHFVANDSETERFRLDARLDERTLRELYLPPFEAMVRGAGVWAVMAAYTGLNGTTMTEHPALREILAREWGFDGVVMSDWLAVRSTEPAAGAALDLVMPGPDGPWGEALVEAVRSGRVSEATVDEKVLRLLRLAARVGALDGVAPAVPEPPPVDADAVPGELRAAAAAGFVLVRNEAVLPLDRDGLGSVAVLGPNAVDARTLGGGSALVFPPYTVSPLAGLRAALGDDVEVRHAVGAGLRSRMPVATAATVSDPVSGEPGLLVRLLGGDGGSVLHEELRGNGQFVWSGSFGHGIAPGAVDLIEVRYRLRAPVAGDYELGCSGLGYYRLTAGETVLVNEYLVQPEDQDLVDVFTNPPYGGGTLRLAEGEEVDVTLVHTVQKDPDGAGFRLVVVPPAPDPDEEMDAAVALAAESDVAVVVVGTTEEVESEGFDRVSLALPGRQDELVRRVAAVNPRTVVVVNAGAPVLMPWLGDVQAVLLTWFPGQEFGNALADVLLGIREPGGRLPTTWPVDEKAPLPGVRPREGVLEYTEGLHVGHRRFLREGIEPAFWFGHGLGYTTWAYLDAECHGAGAGVAPGDGGAVAGCRAGEDVVVRAAVRNTGERSGREVIQVYASRPESAVERPERWLVGHTAVEAGPGEARVVEIRVPAWTLGHWDVATHGWVVEPGGFRLAVARSAGDRGISLAVEVLADPA